MATIALYANKISQMPELIKGVKTSVNQLKSDLTNLQNKANKVDAVVCDLSEVISSIRASTQVQEDRVAELENFQTNSEDFIRDAVRIDDSSAETINQEKKDFYEKYSYLKPDCEKSFLEQVCDGLKAVAEWCKEHWREILIVLEAVVAIVCLCIPGLEAFGALILENMLKGLLIGVLAGGIVGGMAGYAKYGVQGILPGILQGAENGALTGAAFGGLGGLGGIAGEIFGCSEFMVGLFSVSSSLSLSMLLFDSVALLYDFQTRFEKDTGVNLGFVDPDAGRVISELNKKAHEKSWYNTFQLVVGGTAAFSGGYVQNATCFIAGTLVATANGPMSIEKIKVGDTVISADPDSGVTEPKKVLRAFHRTVSELVHLRVGGELITTTHNHPFYVAGKGFVNAGLLHLGDCLLSSRKTILKIDEISFESTESPVTVYNFEVEDYHSYFVGENGVYVHNAACTPENAEHVKEHLEGSAENAGAKPNGMINGCHEQTAFNNELAASGGEIVSTTPVEGMDGVSVVEYQTATGRIGTKTVYDSSVISTEQYMNRGAEAIGNLPGELSDYGTGQYSALDNSGLNWDMYIRNGEVVTIYPNP